MGLVRSRLLDLVHAARAGRRALAAGATPATRGCMTVTDTHAFEAGAGRGRRQSRSLSSSEPAHRRGTWGGCATRHGRGSDSCFRRTRRAGRRRVRRKPHRSARRSPLNRSAVLPMRTGHSGITRRAAQTPRRFGCAGGVWRPTRLSGRTSRFQRVRACATSSGTSTTTSTPMRRRPWAVCGRRGSRHWARSSRTHRSRLDS